MHIINSINYVYTQAGKSCGFETPLFLITVNRSKEGTSLGACWRRLGCSWLRLRGRGYIEKGGVVCDIILSLKQTSQNMGTKE